MYDEMDRTLGQVTLRAATVLGLYVTAYSVLLPQVLPERNLIDYPLAGMAKLISFVFFMPSVILLVRQLMPSGITDYRNIELLKSQLDNPIMSSGEFHRNQVKNYVDTYKELERLLKVRSQGLSCGAILGAVALFVLFCVELTVG